MAEAPGHFDGQKLKVQPKRASLLRGEQKGGQQGDAAGDGGKSRTPSFGRSWRLPEGERQPQVQALQGLQQEGWRRIGALMCQTTKILHLPRD